MSTNESKNPNIILDEISKRLNRISGGSRLFPLHEAIKIAKADHSKLFESFNLIKTNLSKFGQPTAASNTTVQEIIEIIDIYAGYLSLEEIEALNLSSTASDVTSTDLDAEPGFKHIITQEDLDNNPELVGQIGIGEEIFVPGEEIEVTQEFLDANPELIGDVAIGDRLMVDNEIFDDNEFDSIDDATLPALTAAGIALGNVGQVAQSIGEVLSAVKPVDDAPVTTETLQVSKTFEGKKTKVTKKMIAANESILDLVKAGDFVYINENNLTAYIRANSEQVIVLDEPIKLS